MTQLNKQNHLNEPQFDSSQIHDYDQIFCTRAIK